MARAAVFFLFLLAGCAGSSSAPAPQPTPVPSPEPRRVTERPTPPEPKNVVFSIPGDPARIPTVRAITLPKVPAGFAVWGSTGRDHRGRVYYGVSVGGADTPSAYLVEYDPETGRAADRGGAVERLRELGLAKPGESQNKIHTKIWQAADGHLYFASFDEGGENEDGSKPPDFGSHVWRMKPDGGGWEHLAAVRESLIASAVGGRFVYFLGYFGHVLYQWDTDSQTLSRPVRVGSVGGHTTRNILADDRGHVYVPRVTAAGAELVEFDDHLQEVAKLPLAGYSTTPDTTSHGIVAVTALKDGGFAFLTDRGRLHRLTPRATGAALADLGPFHPAGECYCATLFSTDGEAYLFGLGRRAGGSEYEWIAYDLRAKTATATKLAVPAAGGRDVLIYGCQTRDDDGRFYIGGRYLLGDQSIPAAWRIEP